MSVPCLTISRPYIQHAFHSKALDASLEEGAEQL